MIGRSTRGVVVALAACIVLLLGAGVAGALTIDVDGSEPAGVAAPPEAPPAVPPQPPVDLAAVVVPGPSGFDQIPDGKLLVGGAADLDRLAAERTDEARARAVFAETGLVNGFVRAWQKPATMELVTVRLYQFNSAEGAKAYATKVVAAMSAPPATSFTVPATTDTVGIDTQLAQGPNRLAYVVSRKGRVVAAIAATLVPPPEAGFLAPLSRAQLSLLP